MNNNLSKKMGELRGRKKDKAFRKLSKRKVRYSAKQEITNPYHCGNNGELYKDQ